MFLASTALRPGCRIGRRANGPTYLALLLHLRVVNFLGGGGDGGNGLSIGGGLLALGSEDVARQVGEHSVAL